jgi:hypothetical protein
VLVLSEKKQDWDNIKEEDLAPYDIRYKIAKLSKNPKASN